MKTLKVFVLSGLFLTGCGPVLQSLQITGDGHQCPNNKKCEHLLTYALPQTYIEFVGTQKETGSGGAGGNQNLSSVANETAPQTTTATASVGNITVNTQPQSAPGGGGSLPKISFQNDKGEVFYEITVREHVYADEPERYSLIRQGDIFSKDTINVSVNNRGLLTNAAITSDGRIDETLVALARSAGSVIGALSGLPGPSGITSLDRQAQPEIKPFRLICKVEAGSLTNAYTTAKNTQSACGVGGWQFSIVPAIGDVAPSVTNPADRDGNGGFTGSHGIYYRIRRLGILKAQHGTSDFGPVAHAPLVYIDSGRHFSVQPKKNGFGENNQTLTFENGVLLSHNAVFESTAEQIASLPADIIGGLLSAVSNIFTFRVNNTNNEKSLIEAQKALEQAIADLQAQREAMQQ